MIDDPTIIPSMKGSHGQKPAVGPLPIQGLGELQRIVLASIEEIIDKPWPGDRLAEGLMRSLLTVFHHVLEETGYYDGETPEDGTSDIEYMLCAIAAYPIEDMEGEDLDNAWLTVDDIHDRIKARMVDTNRWWTP
jgi:hypothetical protein